MRFFSQLRELVLNLTVFIFMYVYVNAPNRCFVDPLCPLNIAEYHRYTFLLHRKNGLIQITSVYTFICMYAQQEWLVKHTHTYKCT